MSHVVSLGLTENVEKKMSNRKISKKKQENVESGNVEYLNNKKENVERKIPINKERRNQKHVKGVTGKHRKENVEWKM